MVKAADFKFDTHFSKHSPNMTLKFFKEKGVAMVT